MDVFGVGVPELFFIMVIALIFIGPEKLPEVARTVGGWVREIRGLTSEATSVWREAMDIPDSLREIPDTFKSALYDSNTAKRGNPTSVTYTPAPQPAVLPASNGTNGAKHVAPAASVDLAYPAPFDENAAPVVNPRDDRLEYPAPFDKS